MLAQCLAPCLAPRPFSSGRQRRQCPRPHERTGVLVMAGSNKRRQQQQQQQKQQQQQQRATTEEPAFYSDPLPEPEKDFFEGEGWEIIGKVLSFAVPIVLVSAVLIGAFAAGTYNEGATVFLDTPKSQDDTIKFFSITEE